MLRLTCREAAERLVQLFMKPAVFLCDAADYSRKQVWGRKAKRLSSAFYHLASDNQTSGGELRGLRRVSAISPPSQAACLEVAGLHTTVVSVGVLTGREGEHTCVPGLSCSPFYTEAGSFT